MTSGRAGRASLQVTISEQENEDGHSWTVCVNVCDLSDADDATLAHMVQAVRDAYGEQQIRQEVMTPDPAVAELFDLDAIIAGFRLGLPDPSAEATKPANLRNYRSETSEFFARETLQIIFNIDTPPTLHACKGNALQPLLGYDGWGLLDSGSGKKALVLIQVKGSDDKTSPPQVSQALAAECALIKQDTDKLARALSASLMCVRGTPLAAHLLHMLEQVGKGMLPELIVAPVIVRGNVPAQMSDLEPIRLAAGSYLPVLAKGVTVTLGASLETFGREVMSRARQA